MKRHLLGILLIIILAYFKTQAQSISAGATHSLFICSDSTVMATGRNDYGQLGDGTIIDKHSPIHVNTVTSVIAVSGGDMHSLFLKADGTVWSCGDNNYGQLAGAGTVDQHTPILTSMTNVIRISTGQGYSVFLKSDGTVWSCGCNSAGQFGNGTYTNSVIPIQITSLSGIIAISASDYHTLFLKSDSTVWSCGYNSDGRLGDGTTTNRPTPVQVLGLTGVKAIAAGSSHSLFLKGDGTVWSCGYNNYGQLGDGTFITRLSVVPITSLSNISAIAAGFTHSLFLKSDNTVMACGGDIYGALGLGSAGDFDLPALAVITGVNQIAAYEHSIFMKTDGSSSTAGFNAQGELGDGTTIPKATPGHVSGLCSNTSADVWPGDANNDYTVDNFDLLQIGLSYSQTGPSRLVTGNLWQADSSINWGILGSTSSDIKHADCNGDGIIDSNDTLAINLNFSSAHAFAPYNNEDQMRMTSPTLSFSSSGTTYPPGSWINVDIMAGKATSPASNLYGLAYTVQYDASLVQPGTETISYPASWFGTPSVDAITFGKVDGATSNVFCAETRIDHVNVSGYGKIATFRFQSKSSISSLSTMHFSYSAYVSNDNMGNAIIFTPLVYSVNIDPLATGIQQMQMGEELTAYPNPSNGNFNISFTSPEMADYILKLTNVLGQVVYAEKLSNVKGEYLKQLDISKLGKGVYTITLINDKNEAMKRIIVY